jgi:phosphatidylserine decarboxylase
VKFAREGVPLVFVLGSAALLADVLGWWWVGLGLLALTLFVASFFRDPEREIPEGENLVVSPADGKVVAIDADQAVETAPGELFRRVSIFMSPLNVHVNRIPARGEVVAVKHTPGRFLAAYDARAPRENERNEVALRHPKGYRLVFTQVAGMLARRIVCRLRTGQVVEPGERYGLIMFGSRVDVYLPKPASLRVKIGDRVRAGTDVLAELP